MRLDSSELFTEMRPDQWASGLYRDHLENLCFSRDSHDEEY